MASKDDEVATGRLLKELSAAIRTEKVPKTIDLSYDEFVSKAQSELNIDCISRYEYRHISGLYKFMSQHPELKDRQVADLLDMRPLVFWFLNECVQHIRDFLPELRKNGVREMAIEIATRNALRMYSDILSDK